MKLAELSHGTIRRGRRVVLHAASVSIPTQGVVGLVGVNGAGKSTLFHALARSMADAPLAVLRGAFTPGQAVAFAPGHAVSFAPQQSAFPDWLAVPDVARLYGWNIDELARQTSGLLLDEFAGMPAHALSAGQRQALAIALALAADSPLTLLDEPSSFLSFPRRFALARLLRARRGAAARGLVFLSSQSAADLLDTCDWILVLRDGRYVHSGATDSLAAGIADPARARQRFEEAVMALLGAASPTRIRAGRTACAARTAGT